MFLLILMIITLSFLIVFLLFQKNINPFFIKIADKNYVFESNHIKIALCIFIFISTSLIYSKIGYYDKLDKYYFYKKNHDKIVDIQDDIRSTAKVEEILKQRINLYPYNNKLKVLLARIYLSQGKYLLARNIIGTADINGSYKTKVMEIILEVDYRINKKLSDKNIKIANIVIEHEPENKKVLSLLIAEYYRTKKYSLALDNVNKILPYISVGTDDFDLFSALKFKLNSKLKGNY
ncbi:MAG: hypothetical protein VX335_00585 [Pseudomonadota bacterium]|nr:hypothetical protein [Pseudomonadota bacterium]